MKKFSKLKKAFVGMCLFFLTIIFGGWWFENWRGERQWEAAKARAESMGVALEREAWVVDIPEEEDLMEDPLFYDEFFVRTGEDRLRGWSKLPGVDDQFAGGIRPSIGTTIRYRDWFVGDLTEEEALQKVVETARDESRRLDDLAKVIMTKPVQSIFRNKAATNDIDESGVEFANLLSLARGTKSAAMVSLRQGDSTRALKYLQLLNRLAEMSAEPSLVNYLLAGAIGGQGNSIIWEGIRLRAWNESDLEALAKLVSKSDLREKMKKAYQFEIVFGLDWLDSAREDYGKGELDDFEDFDDSDSDEPGAWLSVGGPEGWHNQRRAFVVNQYLNFIEKLEGESPLDLEGAGMDASKVGRYSPVRGVAASLESVFDFLPTQYQKYETARRIAQIGIALEQFFQANGAYPADLLELKIDFPIQDLTDPKGRDLAYQLGKDGRPEIWSIYDFSAARRGFANLRWQFWED